VKLDCKPCAPFKAWLSANSFLKKLTLTSSIQAEAKRKIEEVSPAETANSKVRFKGMFSRARESHGDTNTVGIARKGTEELSKPEKSRLDGYFVRVRYNDRVMTIPGCKPFGKHLDGDESFCTLVS